ncbi:MAG: hypothetical protein WA162_04030 [Thermodesulfobacteriota bacterium]
MRAAFLALVLAVSGCAAGYNKFNETLGNYVRQKNCSAAASHIGESEKSSIPASNERLLFFLDAGMAEMLCGRYEESNRFFREAERIAEELWTKSVTREVGSVVLNDYLLPYAGEDFERALINLFSAINYAMLGKTEDALVEIRRLDTLLTGLNNKYDAKNIYKEDAFARYLSGLIYESSGQADDAFIDYNKAVRVYGDYGKHYGTRAPASLKEDFVRLADASGRTEEVKQYLADFGRIKPLKQKDVKKLGRAVFIHFNGEAPRKVDDKVMLPTAAGPVTLAFPRYVSREPSCGGAEVVFESGVSRLSGNTELAEDVDSIAVKNLDDRKARIVAKELLRVAAKQVIIHQAAQSMGGSEYQQRAVKGFLNVLASAVAKADTRSWTSLPSEIYLSRTYLEEGTYKVSVKRCDAIETLDAPFAIKQGETKFIIYGTMY